MLRGLPIPRSFSQAKKLELWRLLAVLLVVQSLIFFAITQSSNDFLFVLIIWWGAFLVMEKAPPLTRLLPSPVGTWLGFSLILWVLWRSLLITSLNLGASLLPFLAGLGLALLATPLRRIRCFLPSLLILALLPLMRALQIPYPYLLNYATALLTMLILVLSGLPVQLQGEFVALPGGSVIVSSACTGLPAMLQLLTVSIIFAIAFPMRLLWQNLLMTLCAVWLGFFVNGFRIALLALINSSNDPSKKWWFELFHNGWPALLFPAIAAFLFVNVYLFWLERQVEFLEDQSS
jgi:cyanoexosortase A